MKPTRIVAFGSSSVQGRGDPERGGFVGRLDRWYQSQGQDCSIINLGLIGDSTRKMLSRFEEQVPSQFPDLIILYPGLNDTRRKSISAPTASSTDEFEFNVLQLVQRASAIAQTIFISAFPIDETRTCPWSDSSLFYLQSDAVKFTEIGYKVCQSWRISYLPVFETWSKLPQFRELSLDGLHGTPQAHEKLANELKEKITGMVAR